MNVSNRILYSFVICVCNFTQFAIARTTCCNSNRFGRRFFIHRMRLPTLLQLVKIDYKSSPVFPELPLTEIPRVIPNPIKEKESAAENVEKALLCSKLICSESDLKTPVCACNYNTGNVVSFNNKCDMMKHNCRFDTGFKPILSQVCPWEFESRSAKLNLED